MAITKIGTPELFDFSATNTALQLPTGDTASRPSAPSTGEWRYNTELKYVEYYDGAAWFQIDTEADANPDDFPSQNFNVNTYFGNGATQAIDAKFNEAANFNGSSSKIALSNYIVGDWNTGGHTISFWVKFNDFNNDHTIYTETNTQYLRGYANIIFSTTKKLKIQYHQTNGSSGNRTLQEADFSSVVVADTWYNMVIAGNDSSTLMYINGVSETVTKTTGLASSNSNSTFAGKFGEWDSGGDVLDGSLDQVRFYNTTLNQTGVDNLQLETTTTASTLSFPSGETAIATFQFDGDASDVGGTYGGVTTDIGYTGLKFEPDFVWIKTRTDIGGSNHFLFDSIRGATNRLFSNLTSQEAADLDSLTAFDSNGFTVDDDISCNGDGESIVAWCWKAASSNATNNDGSIQSTVRANVDAGFSIVSFTFSSPSSSQTVGHGLNATPELIISKSTSDSGEWYTYHKDVGTGKYLTLNSTSGETSYADGFSTVNSTVWQQYFRSDAESHVAYCFHSVDDYQKIGSYTGETPSQPFVETGFQPAFVMIKRTDTSGYDWNMYDNKRDSVNPNEKYLEANTSDAEATGRGINFFSNGFQIYGTSQSVNASGGTYIYIAIAADKDTSVPTQANSFSPLSYSGTGALQNLYTPFAPDLSWIKSISNNTSHELNDSVRGQVSRISTDTTGAASDVANGFLSLDPNGFSLNDAGGGGEVNTSGRTYVGWSWKAGGLPTINNDGTITSIVSANQAAGFSIVKYTGNNTQNATVGHGLGIEPKMVIIKRLDVANAWWIPLPVEGSNKFMEFSTASATTDVQYQYTQTTDVFKFTSANQSAQYNASGGSYIMYSFADIANYQKIGTYTGSNSSSKVVPTGFQPRFLLIKSLTSNGNYWNMFDSARTSAPNGKGRLYANGNFAEDGTLDISFDSTSFEILTSNSDINGGNDYLYLAIA